MFSNSHEHLFLGTSSIDGCTSWKGRDVKNGSIAFIKNWYFDINQIISKCPMSCEYIAKPEKCQGHGFDLFKILSEIVQKAKYLINNVKHRNLVRYLALNMYFRGPILRIQVAQEFIEGESIQSICENGRLVNVASISKEVLDSIIYMQNKPTEVTHGYLNDKSIFLDKSGLCRVADFDLIPYLMYLKGFDILHKESDVNALGNLVARLSDIIMKSTNDFIDQCHSGRIIHFSDLLKHHFLSNNWYCNEKPTNNNKIENFHIENELGRGSFGVVLKAKQQVDKKFYAIKIIEMPEKQNEYEKFAREAELISRINHKHIVRHITSWKQQNVNLPEFRRQYSSCSDDESMETGTFSE